MRAMYLNLDTGGVCVEGGGAMDRSSTIKTADSYIQNSHCIPNIIN